MRPATWRLLCFGSFAAIIALGIAGAVAQGMMAEAPASPAMQLAFAIPIGIAFLLFLASVPPVAIRFFIAAQERIGNAAHPVVRFLRKHERAVVIAVWLVWIAGALVAAPVIVEDILRAP
jgi:hypothetical protein